MAKPKIAAAVGTASGSMVSGEHSRSKRIEDAMTKAVEDALAEGVPMDDVDTIKARKMAARAAVLSEP